MAASIRGPKIPIHHDSNKFKSWLRGLLQEGPWFLETQFWHPNPLLEHPSGGGGNCRSKKVLAVKMSLVVDQDGPH